MMKVTTKNIMDQTHRINASVLKQNHPKCIVAHGTHTYPDFDSLQRFHRSRKFEGVGYHLFVDSQGKIHQARPYDREGAHAWGYNFTSVSLGIYIKPKDFPVAQEAIDHIRELYGDLPLISHTQAQASQLNHLFQLEGIDAALNTSREITTRDGFTKLESDLQKIVSVYDYSNPVINAMIAGLKNCPGEGFRYLR
jgi:hypothetical protein